MAIFEFVSVKTRPETTRRSLKQITSPRQPETIHHIPRAYFYRQFIVVVLLYFSQCDFIWNHLPAFVVIDYLTQ